MCLSCWSGYFWVSSVCTVTDQVSQVFTDPFNLILGKNNRQVLQPARSPQKWKKNTQNTPKPRHLAYIYLLKAVWNKLEGKIWQHGRREERIWWIVTWQPALLVNWLQTALETWDRVAAPCPMPVICQGYNTCIKKHAATQLSVTYESLIQGQEGQKAVKVFVLLLYSLFNQDAPEWSL